LTNVTSFVDLSNCKKLIGHEGFEGLRNVTHNLWLSQCDNLTDKALDNLINLRRYLFINGSNNISREAISSLKLKLDKNTLIY
jgi:hypothetical protein